MTVIAGLPGSDVVVLGADSLGWGGPKDHAAYRGLRKVWRAETYVGAFSGMAALLPRLHRGELPEWNGEGSVGGWILDGVAPSLNTLAREYRDSYAETDWLALMSSSQLLLAAGDPPELWSVGTDLAVMRHTSYYAAGSGRRWAEGSFFTTDPSRSGSLSPEDRMRLALAAAAFHCVSVGEPFDVLCWPAHDGFLGAGLSSRSYELPGPGADSP